MGIRKTPGDLREADGLTEQSLRSNEYQILSAHSGEIGKKMESQTQTWVSTPFNIERRQGKNSGTQIIAFSGPFTARDMYGSLTPDAMRRLLEIPPEPATEPTTVSIFDLTQVPYVDSSGLGMIARHFAHCRRKGIRFVVAGLSPRVLELFKLTKMDAIVPMSATVEEAQSN